MSFAPELTLDPETQTEETDAASEPSLAELQRQLIEAQEDAERERAAREREQGRLDRLLAGREEPASRPEPLGAMPDPAEDPTGAQAWILETQRRQTEELESRLEKRTAETNARIDSETRAARLWDSFATAHPAYAQRRDLAQMAFQSLASKGSLPTNEDRIPAAVKAEMDRLAGTPLESLPDSKPADRTAGTSSGDRPAPPRPKAETSEDEIPTIHSAVSKKKKELGLI